MTNTSPGIEYYSRFENLRLYSYSSILIISLLLLTNCLAFSQRSTGPYQLSKTKDIKLLGLGLGLEATAIILNYTITPLTADEIDQLDPQSIGRIDRNAIYNYSLSAKERSDRLLLLGFVIPLTLLIPTDTRSDFLTIGMMSLETVLITHGLTGVVKGITQRVRPYAYNEEVPLEDKTTKNAKRSFFSGHVSNYSSLLFFTSKVISDYSNNRVLKIVVWISAATTSAYMGYLRVEAGKHFPTDVVAGYFVGAITGIIIPEIHKNNNGGNFSYSPIINPNIIGVNFRYNIK